ncbi:hypothetical protein F1D05_00325 [Kribbella qitaiheensis]|uniref:HNH endonuclease n=1 Tax=Kribbella qitaiheensis TaxID=1544730 RepID=A0A7G6WRL0_9ACTN|nr:hypothetical protein [Kribbella qitaiheensis]QNE16625.1 hypothetical protein F1D05_00325 [Kribbella qitaiheensis]
MTRFIDGEPSINIQIAHIHALEENGPRFVSSLTIPERNLFRNLLLLCQAHHNRVDSKQFERSFPATRLLKWKRDREGDAGAELAMVQIKDNEALRELFTDALHEAKVELLEAIGRVEKVSLNQAAMLRTLVDESFGQPRLNEDAVASLERSARMLVGLEDTAGVLYVASQTINEDTVISIQSATKELNTAVGQAKEMGHSLTAKLESFDVGDRPVDEVEPAVYYVDQGSKWLFFLRGMGVGAALVAVIILAIVITRARSGA